MVRRKGVLSLLAAVALITGGLLVGKQSFTLLFKSNISSNSFDHHEVARFKVEIQEQDYRDASTTVAAMPRLTLHKKVKRQGIYQHTQSVMGSVMDIDGIQRNISANITSELVYSFSPRSEELFSSKIVDPNREQKVFANSPAMIWKDGKFVVTMRMWLDQEATLKKVQNKFSDNYFYMRTFSESMVPLDGTGRILGMPTVVSEGIGDGPIEPRAFIFYDKFYISYNTGVFYRKKQMDTTFFWDMEEDKFIMPEMLNGQPQLNTTRSMPRDKHWSPYTWNDQMFMLYSLDPLRILKCNPDAKCSFAQNESPNGYQFDDIRDSLRGGTPTLHYKDQYYVTVAHSTLFRSDRKWKRYYTINLVVLKVSPASHQIVYLSEPINFNPKLMSSVPMVRSEFIDDPFFFPVSLLMEDEDNLILGGHINDHSAYLFRLSGIKALMSKVMSAGETLKPQNPRPGLLHKLSKQLATTQSGIPIYFQ